MEQKAPPTVYEQWIEKEGLRLIDVPAGTDLTKITQLEPWDRMGAKGVFLNQPDTAKGTVGAYMCEISPNSKTRPEKHLFEENVFVLEGHGVTQIWTQEQKKVSVEWKKGDYFTIPLNVWFQITNLENVPAKIISVNPAPLIINQFNDLDFIFKNDYVFKPRFSSQENYYVNFKEWYDAPVYRCMVYESNLVRDIANHPLAERPTRGPAIRGMRWQTGESTFIGFSLEEPTRTYAKAHNHINLGWFGWLLKGEGYTLFWSDETIQWSKAKEKKRLSWHAMCIFGYPDPMYHQHFNIGDTDSRYLAIMYVGSPKHLGGPARRSTAVAVKDRREGGTQVPYAEEDPEILRLFTEELKKRGKEPAPLNSWRYD